MQRAASLFLLNSGCVHFCDEPGTTRGGNNRGCSRERIMFRDGSGDAALTSVHHCVGVKYECFILLNNLNHSYCNIFREFIEPVKLFVNVI